MPNANLLQALTGGYVLEDGSFGVLELQFEQEDDKILDFSFAADLESMSALTMAITQLVANMLAQQQKSGQERPPTTLGFKSIDVEPGNRMDESDAVTLRMTTTSGLGLVFGLERRLAEELLEGLQKTLTKN
jgi:hypothetical protein